MSNFHLKDKRITLKAKGLLSQILSLPKDWDYTVKGLSHINLEKVDAIRTAIIELEKAGYITRSRERNALGQLSGTIYIIREESNIEVDIPANNGGKPKLENPVLENPTNAFIGAPVLESPKLDFPVQGSPALENPKQENPMQLNTYSINNEIIKNKNNRNTDLINHSFNPSERAENEFPKRNSSYRYYYQRIRDNIEYDVIANIRNKMIKSESDRERIDEIVDTMVDMLFPEKPTVRIGDCVFPHEVVKSRLFKLTCEHIVYIMDCIDNNTTKIKNMSAYLRKVIYNAPTTCSNHLVADINNMMYGDRGSEYG
jgi:hypothetical protein